MISAALYSSVQTVWETPPEFFNALDLEFRFDLDVCALPENAKCERYFSPDDDGLSQKWEGTCWMNPPYGREIGDWVRKAYEESIRGCTVVGLLPARTDTRWFHDYVRDKAEIRFVKGRLKFVGARSSAPFPSIVAIWR